MSHPNRNSNSIWSVEHAQYYRQEFKNGRWETIWEGQGQPTSQAPIPDKGAGNTGSHNRQDSAFNQSAYAAVAPSNTFHQPHWGAPLHPTPALQVSSSRQGTTVAGSYNYVPEQQHYETLDPSFYVRHATFFTVGKVFNILLTEPAGSVTSYNSTISTVRFGEKVFTQVRRFIVVRTNREFCYACPIFTYGRQATTKPGVRPEEHAIVYSEGRSPKLVPGEKPLTKQPICITDAENVEPLDRASRIYFGIHHPIQYNVKVKDLGDVHPSYVPRLRGYWNMMNQEPTAQDPDVTAAALRESEEEEEEEEENDDDAEEEETYETR